MVLAPGDSLPCFEHLKLQENFSLGLYLSEDHAKKDQKAGKGADMHKDHTLNAVFLSNRMDKWEEACIHGDWEVGEATRKDTHCCLKRTLPFQVDWKRVLPDCQWAQEPEEDAHKDRASWRIQAWDAHTKHMRQGAWEAKACHNNKVTHVDP